MMAIFFIGMGLSLAGISFTQTPLQLGVMLLLVGAIASIYHPVGTAMLVSNVDKLGKEMGINGMWGNVGVASSALITGVINQYVGWRAAFWVPGIVCLLIGFLFMRDVPKAADGFQKNPLQEQLEFPNPSWFGSLPHSSLRSSLVQLRLIRLRLLCQKSFKNGYQI